MTPRVFYGWVLVAALGVTTIVSYGTTQYLFGVLVVPLQDDLGTTRAQLAGAYSLGFLLSGVLGLPVGRLLDRHGARALMSAGSALAGLCLLGVAWIHQLWQLYLLWAVGLGLAMSLTLYNVTFVVITNWFQRRRGSALAVLTVLGGLASPVFIPMAGWLLLRTGWRTTVIIMGATQLLIALPIHALLVRRRPEDMGLRPDGGGGRVETAAAGPVTGISTRQALGGKPFWTLTVAAALSGFGVTSLFVHQIPYLIAHGYDPAVAAGLAGLVGLASLPGRIVFNALSDRLGPQGLLAFCTALQGAGVAALVLAPSGGGVAAYVACFGAAFGAISPLRASVMAEQFGRLAYGSVFAASNLPVAFCAALGPALVGGLYDRLGTYQLAFGLVVASFALSAAALVATPRAPPIDEKAASPR